MLATLNNILPDANHAKYAVPCFNCFGYEDTIAFIEVAESLNRAVIVAVNKDMIEYMPMQAIFGFIRPLAEQASVPVVVHLDHAYDIQTIFRAVDLGATRENPQQYDRLFFMKQTIPALKQQAEVIFNILSSNTDRRIS